MADNPERDYSFLFTGETYSPRDPGDPGEVDYLSLEYRNMEIRWRLLEVLCGGTQAMRDAGQLYLPPEPEEDSEQWKLRLNRSFLHEGYADTLDKIVTKPFASDIKFDDEEELDERLQLLLTTVDYDGTTLSDFAKGVLYNASKYGHTLILVDYPITKKGLTKRDEREADIRPYLVEIPPTDLIGVKWRQTSPGSKELRQIRYIERHIEEVGKYGDAEVTFIRVINAPANGNPGTWELWRKDPKSKEKKQVSTGEHSYPGIPVKPFYTKRKGFLTSQPPMEKLAWLNLMHWQSQSDQRNILKIARCGILFDKGLEEKKAGKFVVGANRRMSTPNTDADMFWVEHSGKAIEAGRQDIVDIEHKMILMGMEPFIERPSDTTATGRAIRESHQVSRVQSWIRSEEVVLEDCLRIANVWINNSKKEAYRKLPEEFKINIYNEFFISLQAYEDMRILLEASRNFKLSNETLLYEFKRRGMVADKIDIPEELKRIESEKPEEPSAAPGFNPKPPKGKKTKNFTTT